MSEVASIFGGTHHGVLRAKVIDDERSTKGTRYVEQASEEDISI